MNPTDNHCRVVRQNGRVMSVYGDVADVQIVQTSACASCRIKGICAAGDSSTKTVRVPNPGGLVAGMSVRLDMEERYGWLGVLFAFVLPLIVVVGTLFALRGALGSEELAALAGLAALAPYYGVLYLTRGYFTRTIRFDAHPLAREAVTPTPYSIQALHKEGVQ